MANNFPNYGHKEAKPTALILKFHHESNIDTEIQNSPMN